MGVGSPEDILEGVALGIDMFDSVLPTRVARNGGIFTARGRLNIRNSIWKEEAGPVDTDCGCYTCRHFSAAYLHHLFRSGELLAYTLATIHNLSFMHRFMARSENLLPVGISTPLRPISWPATGQRMKRYASRKSKNGWINGQTWRLLRPTRVSILQ